MVNIAKGTGTKLDTIVAMVYPDETIIDPEIRILAERIAQLPDDQRQLVETLLAGMSIQTDKNRDEQ